MIPKTPTYVAMGEPYSEQIQEHDRDHVQIRHSWIAVVNVVYSHFRYFKSFLFYVKKQIDIKKPVSDSNGRKDLFNKIFAEAFQPALNILIPET